jgi:hypothetical protein
LHDYGWKRARTLSPKPPPRSVKICTESAAHSRCGELATHLGRAAQGQGRECCGSCRSYSRTSVKLGCPRALTSGEAKKSWATALRASRKNQARSTLRATNTAKVLTNRGRTNRGGMGRREGWREVPFAAETDISGDLVTTHGDQFPILWIDHRLN